MRLINRQRIQNIFGSPPYLCDDPEKQERDAPSHRGVRIIGHDGGRRAGRQVGGVGAVVGGVGYSHGVVQHDEEEDEDACRDCHGRGSNRQSWWVRVA